MGQLAVCRGRHSVPSSVSCTGRRGRRRGGGAAWRGRIRRVVRHGSSGSSNVADILRHFLAWLSACTLTHTSLPALRDLRPQARAWHVLRLSPSCARGGFGRFSDVSTTQSCGMDVIAGQAPLDHTLNACVACFTAHLGRRARPGLGRGPAGSIRRRRPPP